MRTMGLPAANTPKDRAYGLRVLAGGYASSWARRAAKQIRRWERAGSTVSQAQRDFAALVEDAIAKAEGKP